MPPPFEFDSAQVSTISEFVKGSVNYVLGGSLIGALTLLYLWRENRRPEIKTQRILEAAAHRVTFWDARLRIQSGVLYGAELKKAKLETLKTIDEIQTWTNDQLREPARLVKLPWWRRFGLFYKPSTNTKFERGSTRAELEKVARYGIRVCYWLTMALTILAPIWLFSKLGPNLFQGNAR